MKLSPETISGRNFLAGKSGSYFLKESNAEENMNTLAIPRVPRPRFGLRF
jgi:hypothetical protein